MSNEKYIFFLYLYAGKVAGTIYNAQVTTDRPIKKIVSPGNESIIQLAIFV